MQQPSTPASEQAMQTLTAQWFNTLVTACKLDRETFQLAQGFPLLGTRSEELWPVMDALPPRSLTQFWNPAQMSQFTSTYRSVIAGLGQPSIKEFVEVMGDYYAKWNKYKETVKPKEWPKGGLSELFHEWEQQFMPPDSGENAYLLYEQMMEKPVVVAAEMLHAIRGEAMVYDKTAEMLNQQMQASTPVGATMNSATESGETTHTWAGGSLGGMYDFFSGSASANYDNLSTKLQQAGVIVEVQFAKLVTFSFSPLAQAQPNDATLSEHKPWYYSSALAQAYQEPGEEMWPKLPTWAQTFGPQGMLTGVKTSLVLARGLTSKITSTAAFGSEEKTAIEASAKLGFFPFFEAEAKGGWTHDVEFHDSGAMTVSSSVPANQTVVLGAIITPSASLFG